MYIPHVINEKTITVILDNRPKSISTNHPNFVKIKALLVSGDHDQIPDLVDIKVSIEKIGNGDIEIIGDCVRFQGRLVPNYQAEKLISMYRQGHSNINPLKNFVVRLMSNPSARAREEFARFADYKELPFDEDGFIYAYKGVDDELWSISGNKETRVVSGKVNEAGKIWNGVNETIEVAREDVDDDCNRHCSYGLHAGSFDYATGFGTRTVLVKIDPKDVVSVPTDHDGQKVRVCKYIVVSEYKRDKDIEDAVISDFNDIEDLPMESDPVDESAVYRDFVDIILYQKLTSADADLIKFYMQEHGHEYSDYIEDLIYKLSLAERIERYVSKKGGEATLKQIQSALKSYSLKQSEIEEIINKFGNLT